MTTQRFEDNFTVTEHGSWHCRRCDNYFGSETEAWAHWNSCSKVVIYKEHMLCLAVCAPKEMSKEELTKMVNDLNRSGTSAGWVVPDGKEFQGHENPCVCEKDSTRLHYVMVC